MLASAYIPQVTCRPNQIYTSPNNMFKTIRGTLTRHRKLDKQHSTHYTAEEVENSVNDTIAFKVTGLDGLLPIMPKDLGQHSVRYLTTMTNQLLLSSNYTFRPRNYCIVYAFVNSALMAVKRHQPDLS